MCEKHPMTKGATLLGGLILLLAALGLASCRGEGRQSAAGSSQEAPSPAGEHSEGQEETHQVRLSKEAQANIGLRMAVVKKTVVGEALAATAEIQPNADRMAHVSPRIGGRAVKILADLGQEVKRGESLAILDSVELGEAKSTYLKARAELEPAQSRLKTLRARVKADATERLLKAKARLKLAQATYEREKGLFERKISAEKELLEARRELEEDEAELEAARIAATQELQQAEADYLRAKATLDAAEETLHLYGLSQPEIDSLKREEGMSISRFSLRTPFAGRVVEKHVSLGEIVEPQDRPFTIANLSNLWILLDIYEKDLSKVRVGTEVTLSVEAYPGEKFRGRVTYLSDLLDQDTRSVKARVEVDNAHRRLKPGMFATATFSDHGPRGQREVLAVPAAAVQRMGPEMVVFVQVGEGLFEKRKVTLGKKNGELVEVTAGLKDGEVVATEGTFYLKSELSKEEIGEGD